MDRDGFPRVARLKDGSSVEISLASAGDGPALLDFYRSLSDEDRLVLKDDVTTPGWLARFLAKLASGASTSLVARADGRICARPPCTAPARLEPPRGRDQAERGRRAPRQGPGLRAGHGGGEAGHRPGDRKDGGLPGGKPDRGRKTFERLGFRKEAELARQVTDLLGAKRDLFIYANDVSHIWPHGGPGRGLLIHEGH